MVIASLALGVGARLIMRLIAWDSQVAAGFSWGGSGEVVLFGALLGAPVALAYYAVRPRLPRDVPVAGLVVGSLMLAGLLVVMPPAAASALADTPDRPVVTLVLFWLLFVGFGASLEWQWQRLRRRG